MGWLPNRLPAAVAWLENDVPACRALAVARLERGATADRSGIRPARHATILLLAGVPVHVVSQRLGHASAVVTMTVYARVLPGSQPEAASLFASRIGKAVA